MNRLARIDKELNGQIDQDRQPGKRTKEEKDRGRTAEGRIGEREKEK